jgi:hypothetical protein
MNLLRIFTERLIVSSKDGWLNLGSFTEGLQFSIKVIGLFDRVSVVGEEIFNECNSYRNS